ncbi:MAG: DUF5931 domain-containing protein [Actinomycetota bacterium]|nr:DUF5931 domain-containing protein [Actinomycetota bacterium]
MVVPVNDPAARTAAPDFLLPLWRAVVVFRPAAWAVAVGSFVRSWDRYSDHGIAILLLILMGAWTVVVTVVYSTYAGRRSRMAGYDLLVTVAFVAATLLTQPWAELNGSAPILTSLGHGAYLRPRRGTCPRRWSDGCLVISGVLIAVRQRLGTRRC